jgi:group I intron endonuclease
MNIIPTASGIYRITCTITKKIYIGSAINLRERWYQHSSRLRHNDHENPKLQHAWNKYGEQSFTFEVLELVLPMSLTAREQYWFNKLKPFDRTKGFNLSPTAGSCLGVKHSQVTRDKLRVRALGNTHLLGHKHSEETLHRMSESHKGKKHTAEEIAKISLAHTKTYIVTAPDGTEYLIHGIYKFCKDHSLDAPSLIHVASGTARHHKGWKARYPDTI